MVDPCIAPGDLPNWSWAFSVSGGLDEHSKLALYSNGNGDIDAFSRQFMQNIAATVPTKHLHGFCFKTKRMLEHIVVPCTLSPFLSFKLPLNLRLLFFSFASRHQRACLRRKNLQFSEESFKKVFQAFEGDFKKDLRRRKAFEQKLRTFFFKEFLRGLQGLLKSP